MRSKSTIVINGQNYDAFSGLPIDQAAAKTNKPATDSKPAPSAPTPRQSGTSLHRKTQHSATLRRDLLKRPAGEHDRAAKHTTSHAHVTKSPLVSRFAAHPETKVRASTASQSSPHVVAAVHQKTVKQKPTSTPAMSSRELKEHLIRQQLDKAPVKHPPVKKKRTIRKPLRVSSVMAACFGIMLLGGYLSYINMPNLSVRVAAAQAGIEAGYPGYIPSGYHFAGPVAYSNGRVLLTFKASGGTNAYQINQQKSNWDSQAVLDNYVAAQTASYDINTTQGLTIYTYDNSAAWVNHGVLYTISGDAPLRTEQVLKIATSL